MKLVSRRGGRLAFQLGRPERRVLLAALALYPQLNAAHQPLTRSKLRRKLAEAEALLHEVRSDHQRENKKLVTVFIRDRLGGSEALPGEEPFTLTLTRPEANWLLEVLNDVRVGSWVKLGEPEEDQLRKLAATPAKLRTLAAMEFCAFFQSALLEALDHR
ncbi:MAG: hypothetical protein HY301_09650 [Verrucomicrobia bacterium]|nr:hypothetical protein [Verrucomicrobiota bacterium]